ncbi:MAG: membrane protein insertase YidC [Crocinitomicaceae bacterium]
MDRNSLIGLLLIGAVLIGFSIYNTSNLPEPEKTENSKKDKNIEVVDENPKSTIVPAGYIVKEDSIGNAILDTAGNPIYTDTLTGKDTVFTVKLDAAITSDTIKAGSDTLLNPTKDMSADLDKKYGILAPKAVEADPTKVEYFTIENEKLKVQISSKGGKVAQVDLKEYKSYQDFSEGNETAMTFTDDKGTKQALFFTMNGIEYSTSKFYFEKVKHTEKELVLRLTSGSNNFIEYSYILGENNYDIDYTIRVNGFDKMDKASIALYNDMKIRSSEKSMDQERRMSTVFFKYNEDSYDYIWENQEKVLKLEQKTQWVAFKKNYFSTFLMAEDGFEGEGSYIETTKLTDENYVIECSSLLYLGLSDSKSEKHIKWYFGPNDYQLLASYDQEMEDVINYGWGLFRWVNIYLIQPMFNLLSSMGMSIGIAIFVITLLIKLLLSPVSFKMYVSSAKMRILKPKIDEINAKYPNKEDQMKKQMEVMQLQKESGANMFSGCIPMLLQMPILIAAFRFFPSTMALRQQKFLWAEDLSTYDAIVSWTGDSFITTIYGNHVSLFTLLMAGTTLFYTWYNSSNVTQPQQPGMPNMKVMMYIFPIMMIFWFNSYSSGLSYYYFISTLMSILIMAGIKKFFVDEAKLKAKMEALQAESGKKGGKQKSKFQERLEMMQKMQQEKQKQNKKK